MKTIYLSGLLFFCVPALSQNDSVPYSKEYVFKEGLYITFDNFRTQSPVTKERIISDLDKNDDQFISKILQKGTLKYKDNKDSVIQIKTGKVWGYARNGIVFIFHGTGETRIMVIGSICHFSALVESPVALQHDPYNLGSNTQPGYSQEQFILDVQTGKVMGFNVSSMEFILQRDPELMQAFTALSKKKKRQSIFIYLRKYNDKHPLLFPA